MEKQEIKEIWVPARYIREDETILDFTGLYEVSDLGRVRSLRFGKTKIMKQCDNYVSNRRTIFHRLMLRKDNKRYMITVHRLVLSSFMDSEYFMGAVADHIEARTKTCCDDRLSNLRWVTVSQNSSTEHCKELKSKALTNRKDLSKRVKVTNLTTGEVTEYSSAMEAGRALEINPKLPAAYISRCKGFYKKLGLRFEYID